MRSIGLNQNKIDRRRDEDNKTDERARERERVRATKNEKRRTDGKKEKRGKIWRGRQEKSARKVRANERHPIQ